ncbi:hypothetical protein BEH94_10875 [Candidatus Altiarchaeales archaeon WOR_SM1_SCG]|nr:hypothetical protein BEH94_10875 [Candidatus Altiarchaeales archaeon WOR_SM1_SCG]
MSRKHNYKRLRRILIATTLIIILIAQTMQANEIQITTDSSNQFSPAIYGDKIVWYDNRNGNDDIYMYDLKTNTEKRITTDSSSQRYPAIYGDKIVWQDYRNGNHDIYMYDLKTNTEKQITTDSSHQKYPAIYGDKIVWSDYRNGNSDIYMYDLSTNTEKRITTVISQKDYLSIYGDKIVWDDHRNGMWELDVYLYDLPTNTEKRITPAGSMQGSPAIYGDKIIWMDDRDNSLGIYRYDLSTNTEKRITTVISNQFNIIASYGDKIVWMDNRNGNWDIYLYNCLDGTFCGGTCYATTGKCCVGAWYSGTNSCCSNSDCANDEYCSSNYCVKKCGNGVCESGETCSSCPGDCGCSSEKLCCAGNCLTPACSSNSNCSDGNTCTLDSCSNAGTCSASCAHTTITSCLSGDGCCPSGCNSVTDNDCSVSCGNGVCESGETCSSCSSDCDCTSGKICCAGSCVTPNCNSNSGCSDGNPCTVDSCSNAGTCSASCSHAAITSCSGGDGCCPSGCTSANDNDCSVACGNNICESGETYSSCPGDCGCSSGKICCAGSCVIPNCNSNSECNDGNSCTVDSCSNAGTCSASCSHATINSCVGGDGCCSSGCNSANDNDCSASCGNDICDSGEDYNNCLQDCPAPIVCGDEICAEGETAISCPQDCDLCYGMVCDSYCSGRLRYHEGTCLNGECVYQTEECSCRCEGGYCTTDPNDRDCDGVTSDVDCDDSNSQNKNRRDLDSDGDGGNDCIDKCPESKGPASTGYCPCAITERCDNCLELGVGEHCDCNEECKSKYCLSKSKTCISVPLQPAIDIQVLSAVSRSPGKITFQVTNKLNNPKIIGKMEIKIPDDVEIHNTVNVEDLGTRGLLGFNIPSGSEKHISVEFSSNNPGDFRFSGEVYWWYEGDDENKHHESLDKTVTIWQFCGGEYCSPDKYCGEDKKCHAEEKADVGASKEEEASPAGVQKEKEDSIWWQNPLFIIAIALIIVVVIFVLKSGKSKAIVRIKETGHEGTDLPETKPLQGIKTKPEIKTQKTTESDEKVINTCKFCGIQIPRKYEYCYDCIKHKKMQDMQRDIPREIKTDDTHLVRSMPELLIDNWLYHHNIKHEVEKKLPIKELRYCDWYLADHDLYIEYWGMMNDESYRKSKKIKEKIYKKNRLKLLGLEQKDIQNLDEIIRFKLEQFGIKLD